MPAIGAKVDKAMTRVDELDADLLGTEQQTCGVAAAAVGAQLRQLAKAATDKADQLADTLLDDVNDLDQVVVEYYETRTAQQQQWADEEGKFLKLQEQVQRKRPPVDGSAVFNDFTALKQGFSNNLKQQRRPCDLTLLDTGVSLLRALCQRLRLLLGQDEQQAVEKIGWDPFDGGDQTTLFNYYQQIGGAGELQEFLTVCQKASKAGGHYTYKGVKHDMYHDSHGPRDGNEQSRTAWKILVDGKIQVVGVGYHKGKNYRAIYPHTGSGAGDYAASNEIADPRT